MLDSLRALGYSFEAAIADIVDNSVAANAQTISIQFRTKPTEYVAVIDDGIGMSGPVLLEAMRHGGVGPSARRDASDLGRFGLGLKTASLSQCRTLTVVSKSEHEVSGVRWSLDRVAEAGDWLVGILSAGEIDRVPHVGELTARDSATIVLWEDFDRATAGETDPGAALGALVDTAREHLALVFHRYLSGSDGGKRVTIEINNDPLPTIDPFLTRRSQALPEEVIRLHDAEIILRPYVLPHRSRMSRDELSLAGGEEGLRRNQGFYLYRNRRLITYGTWFRLLRQEELTKLARVQVDIPNTLDDLWAIDVRKSVAVPPEAVRTALRRVVERIAGTSRHVYKFRGRKPSGDIVSVWTRLELRDGVAYRLNRDHPLAGALFEILDDIGDSYLEHLLASIELSLPIDGIYADMASERGLVTLTGDTEIEVLLSDLATRMTSALGDDSGAVERLLDSLALIEPFSMHPAATRAVAERIRNGRR